MEILNFLKKKERRKCNEIIIIREFLVNFENGKSLVCFYWINKQQLKVEKKSKRRRKKKKEIKKEKRKINM